MTASRTSSASRRGGVLMGVALTLVTLVVVAAIVGLMIARNVKVDTTASKDGDHVTINTPAGSFSIQAHEHGKLPATDLPIYPAARPTKDSGGADFEWTSSDGRVEKGMAVAGAEFITNDPVSQVYDFYHAKLPGWVVSHDGNETKFEESPEARGLEPRRFVVIHRKSDGTHIGVASVGAPAAN